MVNQWGVQSEEGTREWTPCGVHLRDEEKSECLRQKFISMLIDLLMIIFSKVKLQIQVGLIFFKCIYIYLGKDVHRWEYYV